MSKVVLGCPQLSWDRWDNLDLGLGGAMHHARDNLGDVSMPGTTWDVRGCPGTGGTHECPWLSWDRWDT